MSKNVIVNGKTHNGISFLELLTTEGASALFKDIDEVNSGVGMTGLAEVASGVFTVDKTASFLENGVEHGMSGAPDGFAVVPVHFYDTIDENFFGEVYTTGWNIAGGRRSIESNTTHFQGGTDRGILADEKKIYPLGSSFGMFNPTYTDNDGNTGTQEYIWIAWRLAE